MLITSANLRDVDSGRTQPTLLYRTISAIKSGSIKPMTPGVIAYECLLMYPDAPAEDELSTIVWGAFDELDREARSNTLAMVDRMVRGRFPKAREDLNNACEYAEPACKADKATGLHMPHDLVDALPARKADIIDEAVLWVAASPWSSRMEMATDIRDLVRYARGESLSDPSDWVLSVVDGDSDEYDVSELHEIVNDREWYESPNLTLDELEANANDVTQTPSARSTALENALSNEGDAYSYREMVDLAEDIYGTATRQTAQNYVDLIDEDVLYASLSFDVNNKVSELADKLRRTSNKPLRGPDWKLVGFGEDPSELDGDYDDPFEAYKAVSQAKQMIKNDVPSYIHSTRETMRDWLMDMDQFFREANDHQSV
jgi:hypothetical protein